MSKLQQIIVCNYTCSEWNYLMGQFLVCGLKSQVLTLGFGEMVEKISYLLRVHVYV